MSEPIVPRELRPLPILLPLLILVIYPSFCLARGGSHGGAGRGAGGGELNVDGGAIFASLLLLAIMLYFSLDRILGLDRLFT